MGDHDVGGLAGRRGVFVEEVQRHRGADRLVRVHALEVQVQDLLLERVTLHIAQQHLLDVAVEAQVEDRGVEPLVLAGEPDVVVAQLDADGLEVAAVDDGRHFAGETEAAARTLPLVLAALHLDFMRSSHVRFHFSEVGTASRR